MSGSLKINETAQKQFEWVEEMGWHNKLPLEYVALIGSEVGEVANECRGDEPTDRLGEELADIVLRVFDMAVVYGVDIEQSISDKMVLNLARGTRGRKK